MPKRGTFRTGPAEAPKPVAVCFRNDLSIRMFEDVDGVKTYQVEDPETGESFSFGEEEFFLCQSMNGRTSAEEILAAFRERFGMEMRPEHFHDFEEHLLSMRLAVPAPAASSTEAPAEKAESDREASPDPEGSSGWKLFNPERLLIRLEELTRPLLPLVRLSLLALIPAFPAALYVIFRYGVEFRVELVSVSAQLGYLGGLLFTLLTANFARCVVQGIVCAHFGLAPKAFGIRLLRGILPRFYIGKEQVRGQDRRTKLWIYGTSILVRIYLVVLGTLVWALFKNSPTLIPSFGVMIVQAGLIGLVIQLLPFQTTDGFRWLVNYFHLPPNMIVVAITVLTARLTGRELPDTLRGWRGGRYLLYALLLVTALTFGLIMVVNHIASGLARSFPDLFGRATPYILVVVVAFLMVRWGVGKVMHRARRRSRSTKTDDGVLDDLPEGEDLSGDGFLRKHRGWIIAGVLVLMMFVPFAYRPGGEIQVLPPLQQQIQAPVSGKVAEVFFEGGDGKLIPKGTVVAKMISSEIENALLTLEQSRSQQLATIDRAKSELAKLLSGARSEEITAAKAKLDQAVEQVSVAMQELESAKVSAAYSAMVLPRMQQLYRSGSIALLQYEEAKKAADIDKINVQKAEKNLASLLKVRDEAQAQLDLLKSGARPEDIASARHTVEAAQADLARIEQQIQYARQQQTESALLMPFEGYLVDSHLDFKRGAYLKVGDVYATAQNNSDPLVEVQLPEYDMEGVEVGATAQVKLYAYPNSSLTGKVLSIQPAALPSASGGQPSPAETSARIFRLLIEVDKPPFSLKAGMTGYAKINAGYQPLGLLLARPILRFVQIEMWSWLP